jgi:hypothetical protein
MTPQFRHHLIGKNQAGMNRSTCGNLFAINGILRFHFSSFLDQRARSREILPFA